MKDLPYRADPKQETFPTVGHAEYTAPTLQHELDHTDHTDREHIYISALEDLVAVCL